VLAKSAAQAWLSPLLDTVCERLVFILRNLYKLAAERILSEESSRGKSLLKNAYNHHIFPKGSVLYNCHLQTRLST
jgi:hypothetical protein